MPVHFLFIPLNLLLIPFDSFSFPFISGDSLLIPVYFL